MIIRAIAAPLIPAPTAEPRAMVENRRTIGTDSASRHVTRTATRPPSHRPPPPRRAASAANIPSRGHADWACPMNRELDRAMLAARLEQKLNPFFTRAQHHRHTAPTPITSPAFRSNLDLPGIHGLRRQYAGLWSGLVHALAAEPLLPDPRHRRRDALPRRGAPAPSPG